MRARFGDCDPAKLVYYPRFFEWFHDAFEALFEVIIHVDYASVLEGRRVGFPAVQVAGEFRRPVRFGDEVEIEVFLSRLGERSATFEYRVRRGAELLVTASVKVATMDLDRFTSVPVPDDLRAALAPYVEGVEEDEERPQTERLR